MPVIRSPGYLEYLIAEQTSALIIVALAVCYLFVLRVLKYGPGDQTRKADDAPRRLIVEPYLVAAGLALLWTGFNLDGLNAWMLLILLPMIMFAGLAAKKLESIAGRWLSVALALVLFTAGLGTFLVQSYRQYQLWAPIEFEARKTEALQAHLALGGGFPESPDRAWAKVAIADPLYKDRFRPDLLPGWYGWLPAGADNRDQDCRRLPLDQRTWTVCSDTNGRTQLVAVLVEPRANADQREALRNAMKLMLWVADRGSPESRRNDVLTKLDAVQGSRAEIPYGDITLTVQARGEFSYLILAPAPGRSLPDSVASRF